MNESNRTRRVIAFVVVVVLFLIFGGFLLYLPWLSVSCLAG